jgi:N-acetylneuraminic acid mutarotase
MPEGLEVFTMGATSDGGLVAAGGQAGTSANTSAYLYNPTTKSWASTAAPPQPIGEAPGATSGGGFTVFGDPMQTYDPATDSWSEGAQTPRGLYEVEMTSLSGGEVLVMGSPESNTGKTK